MSVRVIKRTITIAEIPGKGWMWRERGNRRRALADMLKLVERDTKELVKNATDKVAVVTVINYETVTDLGTMVVRALTK